MRKEIPILFSTEMVEAIIDGRKTMTRRVLKNPPRPPRAVYDEFDSIAIMGKKEDTHDNTGLVRFNWRKEISKPTLFVHQDAGVFSHRSPYGKPGDILWVRECCAIEGWLNGEPKYAYKADNSIAPTVTYGGEKVSRWKSSIHMPKAASRIWLEVTDVRVERLQDIAEEDAYNEGVIYPQYLDGHKNAYRLGFEILWDKINGEKVPWTANPWVWVVSYKVLSTTGRPASLNEPNVQECDATGAK